MQNKEKGREGGRKKKFSATLGIKHAYQSGLSRKESWKNAGGTDLVVGSH